MSETTAFAQLANTIYGWPFCNFKTLFIHKDLLTVWHLKLIVTLQETYQEMR